MIHLDNITEANRQQDFSVKPSQSGYAAGYWEILEKANAYRNARSSTLLIMNGDTPVGFCMYYDRDYFGAYQLSQITIDAAFQGRGFGREALALILQRLAAGWEIPQSPPGVHCRKRSGAPPISKVWLSGNRS